MTYAEYVRYLSRRVGPAFAVEAIAASVADAIDNPTPATMPAGWGTSPRRAPTAATYKPSPAASYKPAHGGYPGTVRT